MNPLRAYLVSMATRLCGCVHRKNAVCLDRGRHLAYDWTTMRITRQQTAGSVPPRPAIVSIRPIQEYARRTAMEMPHDRNI